MIYCTRICFFVLRVIYLHHTIVDEPCSWEGKAFVNRFVKENDRIVRFPFVKQSNLDKKGIMCLILYVVSFS